MHHTLKNYYSKYFYILSIFIFIITVNCEVNTTVAPTNKTDNKHYLSINLRKLNYDQLEEFYQSFDFVLADVDVIFDDISEVTENHAKVLNKLENANKKIIFYKSIITPDDSLYTDTLADKLRSFNYTTHLKIFNPLNALKAYFKNNSLSGKAYVIGDDEFDKFVKNLDIETIHHSELPSYKDYYTGFNGTLNDTVKAVIIGFDLNINLYKILQAYRYLKNPEVKLFMIHPKPIFGDDYYNAWIRRLIMDTNRTKYYIDRLDGIFGDFLVDENHLTDNKVLSITSLASGDQNFTLKHKFKPLLIGKYKIKKESESPLTYYSVDDFTKMPVVY